MAPDPDARPPTLVEVLWLYVFLLTVLDICLFMVWLSHR